MNLPQVCSETFSSKRSNARMLGSSASLHFAAAAHAARARLAARKRETLTGSDEAPMIHLSFPHHFLVKMHEPGPNSTLFRLKIKEMMRE